MDVRMKLIDFTDGKANCPNCERPIVPDFDVSEWVRTMGNEGKPRGAVVNCSQCGTASLFHFEGAPD